MKQGKRSYFGFGFRLRLIALQAQRRDSGDPRLLRPDVVVVTSIANEHNRSIGSLEDIRKEKSEMLLGLKPEGLAVLNGDDENVLWMKSRTKPAS